MHRFLFIILFSSFTFYSNCQHLVDLLPKQAKQIKSFVPNGWLKLHSAVGDFNNDGIKDYALIIIDSINERIIGDINRSLIILEGTKNGFKLSGYCDSAILCFNCGGVHGDPFQSLSFNQNKLLINHFGGSSWRWHLNYEFLYRNSHWYLIHKVDYYFHVLDFCKKNKQYGGSILIINNYLKGEYYEKELSENDCHVIKYVNKKTKPKPLTKLENFNVRD